MEYSIELGVNNTARQLLEAFAKHVDRVVDTLLLMTLTMANVDPELQVIPSLALHFVDSKPFLPMVCGLERRLM